MADDPSPYPVVKKARLDINIDEQGLESAVKKAGTLRRLRAIVRAMLALWANDRFPTPSEDEIQRQMIHALPEKKNKSQ
jgi:hypothetical protein